MNEVVVKDFKFGDGTPRICVPVFGSNDEEILRHANLIREEIDRLDAEYADRPDLRVAVIEWRSDYYEKLADLKCLEEMLKKLRDIFSDRLLLFTFRSEEQGGELRHDRLGTHLEPVMRTAIGSGMIDLIDVEVTCGNYKVARATSGAHACDVKVIMSYHDFAKTPHNQDIIEKLRDMEILGGDILKIAVMPKNEFDTRRIMELNQTLVKESFRPIALISMGATGVASRYKCKETGSCLTFATIGAGSAPGQMEAADLIALMKNQ